MEDLNTLSNYPLATSLREVRPLGTKAADRVNHYLKSNDTLTIFTRSIIIRRGTTSQSVRKERFSQSLPIIYNCFVHSHLST